MVKFSIYLNRRVFIMVLGMKTPLYEPAHDKTYNKTCVTSKHSDKPVHLLSIARVLVYSSLNSLGAIEGTCDQRRL